MSHYIKHIKDNMHSVQCPWDDLHTTGSTGDGSTVIFEETEERAPGFKCHHSHCSEKTIKDVLKFFGKVAVTSVSTTLASSPETRKLDFKSIKDLFSEPEELVPWIVDGMLASGSTSVLAAKPKAGKTTISTQLAIAIANGNMFLGRKTTAGSVLHLAIEEKKTEVINRYRDQGATGAEQIYIHAASAPMDTIDQLKIAIAKWKPSLVIVDTLFRAVSIENGNDYSEVTRALEPVQTLARESNAHIMLVHHLGKTARDGGDGILGSTAIQGSVDTMIILNRTENKRTIQTIQRYGTDLEESNLDYDEKTKSSMLAGTKKEHDIADTCESILSFLKGCHSAVQSDHIYKEIGGKRDKIFKALRTLKDTGQVLRNGRGGRGDPFMFSINPNYVISDGPDW